MKGVHAADVRMDVALEKRSDAQPAAARPQHALRLILGKSWVRFRLPTCKALRLLASPTGFEPVLPP
jgi:hypothetical protein